MNIDEWLDQWYDKPKPAKLWLDDIRTPPDASWVWCKSVALAEVLIRLSNSVPSFISFDHDMGEGEPTGMDFAKWLINGELNRVHKIPDNFQFAVHSANPCGRDNIQGLLDGYLADRKKENPCEI